MTANAINTNVAPVTPVITADLDFDVELRNLTAAPNLGCPDHMATVRINPTGEQCVLSVVGNRYKVVDHREVIKNFATSLNNANLKYDVYHSVYARGARIFSRFQLEDAVEFDVNGTKKEAYPFLTLTTSHDGSFKVGFMLGCKIDGQMFNLSPKVYSVNVKHLKGIKLQSVLKQVQKALQSFTEDVVPLWQAMMVSSITLSQAEDIIERAINKNVISKMRCNNINLGTQNSIFELYSAVVGEVSRPADKKNGREENGYYRNVKANEFFMKELSSLLGQ